MHTSRNVTRSANPVRATDTWNPKRPKKSTLMMIEMTLPILLLRQTRAAEPRKITAKTMTISAMVLVAAAAPAEAIAPRLQEP